MYLSDRDIRALLSDIAFTTEDPSKQFEPGKQIQPASVDLRLDASFWEQRTTKTIDLRSSTILDKAPRRHWQKRVLGPGETILLPPGGMLVGRTYESFRMPSTCAGKLEGRSSFARLGLAVHCCADFINPGWTGHMPLELVNHGRAPIRLVPLMPICQVVFVCLSSPPERPYGTDGLSSKYADDDGGPSYWWRDMRIKEMQKTLRAIDVGQRVQDEIIETVGSQDLEILERLDIFARSLRQEELTHADAILERFAKQEDRSRWLRRVLQWIPTVSCGPLVAASIRAFFADSFEWYDSTLCAVAVASLIGTVLVLRSPKLQYLGAQELATARRLTDQARSGRPG